MSRLDDHVAAVQNRLALRKFVIALGWLSLAFAVVILLAVLADRILLWHLAHPMRWFYGGLGTIVAAALAYAIYRRPTVREAAVPIDQKLGLKEKISTALFIRNQTDPFARAAVKDAENSAQQVVLKLNEHFPLSFPRPVIGTCAIAIVAWASYTYINPERFFGREEAKKVALAEQSKIDAAKQSVQRALATVQAMPATVADIDAIKLAKEELTAMLEKPITDPAKADRTAVRALQDVQDALKQQVKSSAKYANAQNEMKLFRSGLQKPVEGQGPVSDAHRAIAEGKFNEAIDELEKAVENFDKLDKADQQKAAEQMKNLAQQLQQMAQNNPQQDQKQQQQLQQAGMNQQQAQQAQQLMKQAAQGDKQAAQQLQQMAQQAMQQAGMNPQQQQAAQQMMQQMQAQMNAQNQAQQMQQAAQQMAQAMQQAQQGQQGQQQQGQQAAGQQQGQQGQGQGQGMQGAMQQMQAQLQQMQAAQQDQQQIQAAQQAVQQAQGNGGQAGNGNKPGGQAGAQQGVWQNANNAGQPNQGNNPNPQGGDAGPNNGGQAAGDRNYKSAAPYQTKQEIDPSQDDEKGRILASNLIKDNNPLKGSAKETLKEIANKAANEQTDEVDAERIGRSAQKAVKEYFNSMSKDAQQ